MKKIKLFEQFVNEESGRDTLGELVEMTMGQLERIEDYAEMISDMMEEGKELESWMFSQITIALENLNAVHDALKVTEEIDESLVTEGVANQWGIESHHIGKLQKGKMDKFTDGTSMPFSLISRPTGGVSDTDKKLVQDYVDADHIVIQFYPAEDSNNSTMYDAVESGAIKVLEDLIQKEYNLKLKETLKGKRHCSANGELCSLSHYLVFAQ